MAGRVSHPLDDKQNFMEDSHPPIPIDPQGLVALEFLYVARSGAVLGASSCCVLNDIHPYLNDFVGVLPYETCNIRKQGTEVAHSNTQECEAVV